MVPQPPKKVFIASGDGDSWYGFPEYGSQRGLKIGLYNHLNQVVLPDKLRTGFTLADEVILCSACSGHGFKMSSGIGQLLANMAINGPGSRGDANIQEELRLHRIQPAISPPAILMECWASRQGQGIPSHSEQHASSFPPQPSPPAILIKS
eukprot:gene30787-35829_t